jgi:hypothetical protein
VEFASASGEALSAYRDRLLERLKTLRHYEVTSTSVPTPPTRSQEEYLDFLRWFAADVLPEAQD